MLDRRLEYQRGRQVEGKKKKSTSIKSNIIKIQAQIVFLFGSLLCDQKTGQDMQTLSNFCLLNVDSIIDYVCFIKTKSEAKNSANLPCEQKLRDDEQI
jgi:hypothetical protein